MKKNPLRTLNKYSWSILIAFIFATLAMQYHTANISLGEFFQTLPLIAIAMYCCEKMAPLIKRPECKLKKPELFMRDSFMLSFSFLLACLLSLVLAYNNSDVRGWWPLIICYITLYGLFFSVIFSTLALLIKNHKTYTLVFSLLIILLVSLGGLFPHYTSVPLLGDIDTFFVITCSLLILHCLLVFGYHLAAYFHCKKHQ